MCSGTPVLRVEPRSGSPLRLFVPDCPGLIGRLGPLLLPVDKSVGWVRPGWFWSQSVLRVLRNSVESYVYSSRSVENFRHLKRKKRRIKKRGLYSWAYPIRLYFCKQGDSLVSISLVSRGSPTLFGSIPSKSGVWDSWTPRSSE